MRASFLGIVLFLAGCAKTGPENERELATRVLAEYISQTAAPKKVLVISNPFSHEPGRPPEVYAFEKAGINGIEGGLPKSTDIEVGFPALKPEVLKDRSSLRVDAQTTTPLSFLVAESAFSDLMKKHPGADVVISLIGLPVNLPAFPEWTAAEGPKFALLLPDWRIIGDQQTIVRSFQSGKLLAAIVRKSNAPEGDLTGDTREEFEKRYLLVTAANVETLMREHPGAFGIR